ncbi:hypothetical protein FKM82_003939 [Ascaphus truei]
MFGLTFVIHGVSIIACNPFYFCFTFSTQRPSVHIYLFFKNKNNILALYIKRRNITQGNVKSYWVHNLTNRTILQCNISSQNPPHPFLMCDNCCASTHPALHISLDSYPLSIKVNQGFHIASYFSVVSNYMCEILIIPATSETQFLEYYIIGALNIHIEKGAQQKERVGQNC